MWESCLVITCCSTFCALIVFACTGCASPSHPASEQTALKGLTPLHPCAALTCEASWDSMPGLSFAPPGAVTALLLLLLPEAFAGQMVWCQRGLPTLSDPVTRCRCPSAAYFPHNSISRATRFSMPLISPILFPLSIQMLRMEASADGDKRIKD